ncbi:hypothetical protein [Nioella sediminis]|uniref:hypothetical protein n=1 Tax=Nioella sediminis TaxID=1912092 RepID=UPI000AC6F91E|nr:hypothetical protein [Nioella sediminis]
MGSKAHHFPTCLRRWDEGEGPEIVIPFDPDRRVFWVVFHKNGWGWGGFLRKPPKVLEVIFHAASGEKVSWPVGDLATCVGDYIGFGLGDLSPGGKSKRFMDLLVESDVVSLSNGKREIFSYQTRIPREDMQVFTSLCLNGPGGVLDGFRPLNPDGPTARAIALKSGKTKPT